MLFPAVLGRCRVLTASRVTGGERRSPCELQDSLSRRRADIKIADGCSDTPGRALQAARKPPCGYPLGGFIPGDSRRA